MQTPSFRFPVRLAGLALAAVSAAASFALAGPATSAQAATVPLSGAYVGPGDTGSAATFEASRGRKLDLVTDFLPADSWTSMIGAENPWVYKRWEGRRVAWAINMWPQDGSYSLAQGATGAYDAKWRALAQAMVANGHANSFIRIAWEMNGSWFPWSAVKNPTGYVSYWRHIITAMRSVPGQSFSFVWSTALGQGTSGFAVESAYPGDAYVDVVAASVYDQSWAHVSSQHAETWNDLRTTKYGLDWLSSFARTHGKKTGLSEWGLAKRCDGHGGLDDPLFISNMIAWSRANDTAFESYYNYNQSTCEQHKINNGLFPAALTAYHTALATTTPLVVAPSSVDPSVIRLSWTGDRANSKSLNWMGVSGKVFIFLDPAAKATRAQFYLDDTARARTPMTTDTSAFFDLMGGTSAYAAPLSVSTLSAGRHTLTVLYDTAAGQRVTTATFTR